MKRYILIGFFYWLSLAAFGQVQNCCTDQWTDRNENENYTGRHECSFVQAGDRFIMFGGREQAQKLDQYNFKNNAWDTGGVAPKEFNHFQATAYKGFVWVIAAYKTNTFPHEIPADFIWLYHPPTRKWIQGPGIPTERKRGGAGLVVYRDKFYVVAGNTNGHDGGFVDWFDVYDPWNNTWEILENAPRPRDHFHAAIIQDKLYAAGGRWSGGTGGVFAPLVDTVDVYDFRSGIWSSVSEPLPTPRAAPAVAVANDELLVMGGEGENPGPAFKCVEAYNPGSSSWSKKADMHYARHGTQAIVSGRGIYIACGSPNQGGGRQLNMEVYNQDVPEGEAWIASIIVAPDTLRIQKNSSQALEIKNTGGTTASFISGVEIADDRDGNFQLLSSTNFVLIDVEGILRLEIKHLGKKVGDEAVLSLFYNGDQEKKVRLISE